MRRHNRTYRHLLLVSIATLTLTACGSYSALLSGGEPNTDSSLAIDGARWQIAFNPSEANGDNSAKAVQGQIVIQRNGRAVQSFSHALDRSDYAAGPHSWLVIDDFNGDDLEDILLKNSSQGDKSKPSHSLYTFMKAKQIFEPQDQISNVGDIEKKTGCLLINTSDDKQDSKTFCYSDENNLWVEMGKSRERSAVHCDTASADLKACRTLRIQRDMEMRSLIGEYIGGKTKLMQANKRKTAAATFSKNLRAGHESWLRYRDYRCISYVNDYNIPSSAIPFALESCKMDLAALQLQHYRNMMDSLTR